MTGERLSLHRDEPIRVPKAAELVAQTIRRRVITGEYQPDELLPTETALMGAFNVARSTVRDAFRILESEGLLVVRRGANGGARARPPSIGMVASYAGLMLQCRATSLEDVHLARIMIEAPVAGMLAARRGDNRVTDALHEALAEEAATIDDPVELSLAEGQFHRRLIELTGSRTMLLLSAVANRIVFQHVARFMADRAGDEDTRSHGIDAHKAHVRLVELISVGADEEAEALWRRHLETGLAHLRDPAVGTMVLDVMV